MLGEKIVMSDILNKVTWLVHERPLIGNHLLNSGSSVLSAMPCSFFITKKKKAQTNKTNIRLVVDYKNKICVHSLKHLILHIFFAMIAYKVLIPATEGIDSPPGIDSQNISASSKLLYDPGKFKSACLNIVVATRRAYLHLFYSNDWIYSFGGCLKHFINRKHNLSK